MSAQTHSSSRKLSKVIIGGEDTIREDRLKGLNELGRSVAEQDGRGLDGGAEGAGSAVGALGSDVAVGGAVV